MKGCTSTRYMFFSVFFLTPLKHQCRRSCAQAIGNSTDDEVSVSVGVRNSHYHTSNKANFVCLKHGNLCTITWSDANALHVRGQMTPLGFHHIVTIGATLPMLKRIPDSGFCVKRPRHLSSVLKASIPLKLSRFYHFVL